MTKFLKGDSVWLLVRKVPSITVGEVAVHVTTAARKQRKRLLVLSPGL